ncbi:protein kinase [Streptomyces sp. M2CJ-2]|uniref:protein kinase domain-containing protein n=1 Tax=Streptomyces sp. M2CJ-2 TaxID=2803948 RepID=UPI001F017170|nr:protein kinase [Streptomyces sp. M2CJ-2]
MFESPVPLVVLETLTGETLSHLVHRLRRRPSAADVALLGVQLCSAIHYLHGQGLLHLDLKPSNVVVDCGHAKVLDLSIARPPGPAPAGVGTFCYLAPEQARGGPLSAAADVWGIGITLYEAAAGDVPFGRGDSREVSPGGEKGDGPCDGSVTGGRDDWYPQLEGTAPPIGSRRRLPGGARRGHRRLPSDRSIVLALGCRTGRHTRCDAARPGAPHRLPLRPWRGADFTRSGRS